MVGVVELWLEDLQVAHLEARGGEGHLKVHRDGWPAKEKKISPPDLSTFSNLVHFFFVSVSNSSISADI